ncbi:extracellular solute-binding protein [Anaerovorax odorimutans]|uniref:Extracellular solute-binding protein n=1 Tax=Anaerovorax odorimutans TaxID=109327 RepID=A0ABT1RS01_9FIRM|nr:extracellular solute-binding protein [Anaerovorax odorimutans]MCQ4637979.1 extracellular solute-binding protein [Anaerovorax odorimutans]
MKKRFLALITALILCGVLVGCGAKKEQKAVTIRIKCPPMTMAYDADHPDAEIYDLFTEAADKFNAQYEDAKVNFKIEKFQYVDEKEQVVDKIGTEEAADILFGGSFNMPTYILENRLATWDDVIDDELRGDVDDAIWKQCMVGDKTYLMPYFQLQNTLMVNKTLMKKAGLEKYIPKEGTIAQWSTEEYNTILKGLKASMPGGQNFPMFAYASNNQGDLHTMTFLRAYGCGIFDKEGNFAVNTPEGIKALKWLKNLNEQGITPKGAENMELAANMDLFYNGQMAICMGNQVNLNDCRNLYNLDVFLANFPSPDGKGYATSYLNGFTLFDNGNEDVLKASRDFIRFIYSDKDLLKYSLSSTPVLKSYVEENKDKVFMMQAYSDNSPNVVDFLNNTPNWEGVRAVFYPNIQELYRGSKTPKEVAAGIDASCNAAIAEGRSAAQ